MVKAPPVPKKVVLPQSPKKLSIKIKPPGELSSTAISEQTARSTPKITLKLTKPAENLGTPASIPKIRLKLGNPNHASPSPVVGDSQGSNNDEKARATTPIKLKLTLKNKVNDSK